MEPENKALTPENVRAILFEIRTKVERLEHEKLVLEGQIKAFNEVLMGFDSPSWV
jgi:uncharacterized protein (UPF0335 family)